MKDTLHEAASHLVAMMGCLTMAPATRLTFPCRPPFVITYAPRRKKLVVVFKAKLDEDDGEHTFLKAAINGAALRFHETRKSNPLFLDPYAGCFVSLDVTKQQEEHSLDASAHHYCVATKFIDDQLLRMANSVDGVRQVVLLTDGMDTRPYRLKWPNSTIIFDISPETVFQRAAQELAGVGAKISRGCLFLHIPSESSSIQEIMCRKGFNGSRPSIWVIQGLPVITLASFEQILFAVSSLVMKGCKFIGELPVWLVETEVGIKPDPRKWMDKLFMSNGFRVDAISYDTVAGDYGLNLLSGNYENLLFVAEQLRFSDGQMESWRREFQRLEEEGDEEGFEEL